MTATTVEVNLRISPADLQALYRRIVLQVQGPFPVGLVQTIYNAHNELRQPLIIDMETTTNGPVQKEAVGNNRVPSEPVLGGTVVYRICFPRS